MAYTQFDFVFKVVIVGNSAVGKSSLLLRFSDDVFHESFLPTIGVDFKIRTIEQDGSIIKLQMWDTAGQEKFKTIVSAYYKGAKGILFLFDICDYKSFQDVKNWLSEVDSYSDQQTVKILIGNKCDMESSRKVSKEEAQRFAENQGMTYFEASAKTKQNVETIFKTFAGQMKANSTKKFNQKCKPTKPMVPIKPSEPSLFGSKKTTCC